MRSADEIRQLFRENGGVLRTKELSEQKVFYKDIQQLTENGIIEKIHYGCYKLSGESISEMRMVARLFPDGIFCGETALHHYGYLAALPSEWHLAVGKDSGKSRFSLEYPFVKPYYIEPDYLSIGLTEVTVMGGSVRMYDRERVICDCLRYRNKMDRTVFSAALQRYIADPAKNLPQLFSYAESLRVAKPAREILGLWL